MSLSIRFIKEQIFKKGFVKQLSLFNWALALMVLSVMSITLLAITDSSYVGINNGTGYNTDPSYVDWSISKDKELGVGSVRMGMDGVGGYREGEGFSFGNRDVVVNKYLEAGIKIHAVLSARMHVNRDSNYDRWKANWSYYCRTVMNRYKGKIFWYIIDNETDLDYGNGTLSIQQAVDLTKIAYDIAKSIDTNIMIESPPPTSPETGYLRDMIKAGIGNYCDYIGVHAYGGQINDGRLNRVWDYLNEFNVRKPVVVSEAGSIDEYFTNSGVAASEGRRIWFSRFYYQLKRYAYSHVLLFDLDGHDAWAFQNTPSYNEIKNWYRNDAFANGGFEEANDNEHGWNVFASADIFKAPSTIKFIRGDSGNAHSGNGYLRMDPGANSVRRLAEKLTPNKKYVIKAWVNINGGGTARLKALGWNHLNGNAQVTASTSNGGWQQLSLEVIPTKTWVVIDLSIDGVGGHVRWDDVTIDGSTGTTTGTPTPTPTPVAGTVDLIVTDISWSPSNPVPGSSVTFSATIKNQGTKASPNGIVHGVAFSINGTVVNWSDNSSESLAAGASRTVTASGGPNGSSMWTATNGSHTIEAFVDDINRITGEGDENNNKRQETITVSTATPTPTVTPTPTPTPTATPQGGSGTGLKGEYFDNTDFTSLKVTRTDATINFSWGSGAPASGVGADTFSVRWTGQVEAPATGTYTFITNSDDGVRLWVNGTQLVNNWTNHGPTENSGNINLTAGQKYSIKLEYYENTAGAVIQLFWIYPGQTKQIVPQSRLYEASSTGISNGRYRLTAKHSGKVMEVEDGLQTDGGNVQQWSYANVNQQKWNIESIGDGYYKITAVHSGKALDVASKSTSDGANIHQWSYGGGTNQQWKIESVGDGYYRIVSRNSGKCVDVSGPSTADGANVHQWTCHGGDNQAWKIEIVQ
jgi:hypothetical protein